MIDSRKYWEKRFQLIIRDGAAGEPQVIEFAAPDPCAALMAMERHGEGREAQILENGRPLGTIQQVAGFWRIGNCAV